MLHTCEEGMNFLSLLRDNVVSIETHIFFQPLLLLLRDIEFLSYESDIRRQFYFKGRTNLFCIKMK